MLSNVPGEKEAFFKVFEILKLVFDEVLLWLAEAETVAVDEKVLLISRAVVKDIALLLLPPVMLLPFRWPLLLFMPLVCITEAVIL